LNGYGDLFGQAFLDLQTTTKGLGDAGKLRKSKDKLIWDVSDSNLRMKPEKD